MELDGVGCVLFQSLTNIGTLSLSRSGMANLGTFSNVLYGHLAMETWPTWNFRIWTISLQ